MSTTLSPQIMDCACVIHSTGYDWIYVERLYDMLRKNSRREIRLHVYTESERPVPEHMVKHCLIDWKGINGPKKSWWYKMQLFDPRHHQGPLLYFDLDVIITRNIDWIYDLDLSYFWAVHDFRYLWRPHWTGMNSSVMFWDTQRWNHVWQNFQELDLRLLMRRHHGDQDYLNMVIDQEKRKFLDTAKIKSWRWQIKDGGMDMRTRSYHRPNTGSVLDTSTCVMIFHGNPKPHEIKDPVVQRYWHDIVG